MKLGNALRLYRVRLRARLAQECLAAIGIAAGVALLFASQISSTSLQSSVAGLSRGIAGRATLELLARDPHGFPESTLARVRHTAGVRAAAPLLELQAEAAGPRGREPVELIGADPSLARLGGALVRHTSITPFGEIGAVVLPAPLAKTIGVTKFGDEASFQLAGHTARLPLYAQLRERQVGALASSPVAITQLSNLQAAAGLPGRVSRVLVSVSPGDQSKVRAALVALAGDRLDVETTAYDERLFGKAAAASRQSTQLFSVISALVGFLFAFNAVLLTVPQRRRLAADLRRDGYSPATVIGVLSIDAVFLGSVACVLGLALGDELSIHLFHANPAFLSLAFALGSARSVTFESVAIAVAGGMLAALVAVLSPPREIFSGKRPGESMVRGGADASGDGTTPAGAKPGAGAVARALRDGPDERLLALGGALCMALATALLLASPDAGIPSMVLLVASLLLVLPIALRATLWTVRRLAASIVSPVPHVAAMELSATRSRAVAIAATGAVAVFGSVTIQGAHGDLLGGLERAAREGDAFTDLWVAPGGSYDLLKTAPFAPTDAARLRALPGVGSVRLYRSGLLDYGDRRILVIAPPRQAVPLLPSAQLLDGNAAQAARRVRAGGWLVISRALAAERHLRVGDAFTLPSPVPTVFRVAALSTNLGWAPGAIEMNAADYAHAWGSGDASAYAVTLARGARPGTVAREIESALAPSRGLAVQTSSKHSAQQSALSREALADLTRIAVLIPVVAVLAMAAAIGAMVWQRRPRLAKLKLEGISHAVLWRMVLFESFLLLGVGSLCGALFGLYGQQLADRALAQVINFPVAPSVALIGALSSIALVAAGALAVLALPGYLAASVPAALALQE